MTKQELIDRLVEIEMDECTHFDSKEDYNTPLDFYLSNVTSDTYINYIDYYSKSCLMDSMLYTEMEKIQEEVIQKIKEKTCN